jgi:ubiquinone/menaquinone biosynthesis C-methylase UbiE
MDFARQSGEELHSKDVVVNKADSMRQEWDARARKDAFYYIASWRKDWDVSDFLESGQKDYDRLVSPVLNRVGFSPAGKTMLELGCGAGRMTHAFAARFGRVFALDVSAEMLDRARKTIEGGGNIDWIQANGLNLENVADESVDFAFSYLVLQHLPDEKTICGYIRELFRIVKESGICLFQYNGMSKPTMNWKGQLAWKLIDGPWSMHLPAMSRFLAGILGFDPDMAGKSWHGASMTTKSVAEAVHSAGGTVLEISGEGMPMAWCCATRHIAAQPHK